MKFRLIEDPIEFEALAETWNALLAESITNVPFLRHEYLYTWWQTRGGGEWAQVRLALVCAEDDGHLRGIAPFFLTEHEGLPSLLFLGSIEISDFLDLIVRPADLHPFIRGLFDFLSDSDSAVGWRALDLYNLPEGSPAILALQVEAKTRGWTAEQQVLQPAPYISLPGDFEAYLAGIDKKQRHEIRRKMRRVGEGGRSVRWYIVEDEAVLDAEVDSFLELMANDPQKAAFLTGVMRSQMRAAMHAAFRHGWLQLAFLEIDGQKACGYLNFDYANRIWVYNSGLHPGFMDLSPGWVLLGYLIEWANLNRRAELDFMRGNEAYKYKFGALDRQVLRLKMMR
ncbi:MAG: GNAT family N-acetyltransferase [Candidatus Villigracilaceae bacterium]